MVFKILYCVSFACHGRHAEVRRQLLVLSNPGCKDCRPSILPAESPPKWVEFQPIHRSHSSDFSLRRKALRSVWHDPLFEKAG